jgi:hypothetical protein
MVFVVRVLILGSALVGLVAAALWAWSAVTKQPSFEILATYVADETGVAPANRYLGRVSKLNAWAAGATALSVLLASAASWLTAP